MGMGGLVRQADAWGAREDEILSDAFFWRIFEAVLCVREVSFRASCASAPWALLLRKLLLCVTTTDNRTARGAAPRGLAVAPAARLARPPLPGSPQKSVSLILPQQPLTHIARSQMTLTTITGRREEVWSAAAASTVCSGGSRVKAGERQHRLPHARARSAEMCGRPAGCVASRGGDV